MTHPTDQSSREKELRGLLREWQQAYNRMDDVGVSVADFQSLRRRTHEALSAPSAITAEEAGREGEAKPVRYEWRHFDTANTPHTWSAWHVVEPRNPYTDTMEDRVREYQGYIAAGYKYELRALYVGLLPPAPAQSGGQGNG